MLDPKFRSNIWAYLLQSGQSVGDGGSSDKYRDSMQCKSKDTVGTSVSHRNSHNQGSSEMTRHILTRTESCSIVAPYCCIQGDTLVLSSAIAANAIATAAVMSMMWWIKPRCEEIMAVEWNTSRIVRNRSDSPKRQKDMRSRNASEVTDVRTLNSTVRAKTSVLSDEEAIVGWHRCRAITDKSDLEDQDVAANRGSIEIGEATPTIDHPSPSAAFWAAAAGDSAFGTWGSLSGKNCGRRKREDCVRDRSPRLPEDAGGGRCGGPGRGQPNCDPESRMLGDELMATATEPDRGGSIDLVEQPVAAVNSAAECGTAAAPAG